MTSSCVPITTQSPRTTDLPSPAWPLSSPPLPCAQHHIQPTTKGHSVGPTHSHKTWWGPLQLTVHCGGQGPTHLPTSSYLPRILPSCLLWPVLPCHRLAGGPQLLALNPCYCRHHRESFSRHKAEQMEPSAWRWGWALACLHHRNPPGSIPDPPAQPDGFWSHMLRQACSP